MNKKMNKKMIVNYQQRWDKAGYHYTQTITIDKKTMEDFNNYIIQLKKETSKNFIYTNEDLKIMDLELLKVGINYANLNHLDLFIRYYLHNIYIPPKKDKDLSRILDRNTVFYVIEGGC